MNFDILRPLEVKLTQLWKSLALTLQKGGQGEVWWMATLEFQQLQCSAQRLLMAYTDVFVFSNIFLFSILGHYHFISERDHLYDVVNNDQ